MSNEGKWDQVKGKAREAAGKLTDNKKQEAKGKAEQRAGKVKEKVDDTRDSAEGTTEGIRETFSDDKRKDNKRRK